MEKERLLTRRSFLSLAAASAAALGAVSIAQGNTVALAQQVTPTSGSVRRIRTACRGCGKMECGVWVTVENGRAVKVEGDESAFQSRGNCCTKSQASIQASYHPDRLKWPLIRTNGKDANPEWRRASWEEALDYVIEKGNQIRDQYGPEAIAGIAGTSRVWPVEWQGLWGSPNSMQAWQICKGPRQLMGGMVDCFAFSWMATYEHPRVYVQWGGASELSNYDDSCRTTVETAKKADVHIVVDPRQTNLGKEADYWLNIRPGTDAAVALCWAHVILENDLYDDLYIKRWTDGPFLTVADMEPTGYPENSGFGVVFDLKTRMLKEADLVEGGSPQRWMVWDNLGNRLTYFDASTGLWEGEAFRELTGKEAEADFVSGVAPGFLVDPTQFDPLIDPALFGEFEVTLKDGTVHKAHPVWEDYIESVAEYTPERASEITGVDARILEESCLAWATRLDPEKGYGNGGIQYMLATEHQGHAGQTVRSIGALAHLAGVWDTPGGQRGSTHAPVMGGHAGFANCNPLITMPTPDAAAKMIGTDSFPILGYVNMFADENKTFEAMHDGNPYRVRMLCATSGDFMHQGNAGYNWEAILGLDFMVGVDLWMTPSMSACDVVFPAQHWLEVEGCPRTSQASHGAIGAHQKCVQAPGEALWDPEIFRLLVARMGIPYFPDNPTPTLRQLQDMSVAGMAPSFEQYAAEFQENGWWDCKVVEPEEWGTYRRYETGALRHRNKGGILGVPGDDLRGFYTPTLKAELRSTVLESYFGDGRYNFPTYTEPPHSPIADPDLCEEYPIILTTGRRIPVYFHSEHRQLPWCREQWPAPRVEINPETAKELGIAQGDWVWIESKWGKVRQTADLYYGVAPNVANAEHQWWFPELDQLGKGFELCCINECVDRNAQDPIFGAVNIRAFPVKIYKATAENSPFGNPVPCGNDGTEIICDAADPRLKEWQPVYEGRE